MRTRSQSVQILRTGTQKPRSQSESRARLLLEAWGLLGFPDQGTQPMPTSGEGLTALV